MAHGSPLQAGRVQPAPQQQHSPTSMQQQQQHHHPQMQGPGLTLPSLGTTLQQAQRSTPMEMEREQAEREREREVEMDRHRQALAQREYERGIEAQEQHQRQRQEQREPHQSPLTNHVGPLQLAQPTPRMTSTLHGPNGILNHQNIGGNPLPNVTTPSASTTGGPNAFVNGSRPSETSPHAFPPAQNAPPTLAQQQQIVGFASSAAQQQASSGLAPSLQQGGQQPILTDALSYLDQVKVRFVDQPDVYNQFLDIMKDFKSHTIDTPGVINRVSTLFTGHPELIEGFNTFLPPGYAIKCGVEGENSIRVTTPMGTKVTTMQGIPNRLVGGPYAAPLPNGVQPQPMLDESQSARVGWQSQQDHGDMNGEIAYATNRNASPSPYQRRQGAEPSGPMDYDRDEQVSAENAILHQREQRGVNELTQATSMAMNGTSAQHPDAQVSPLEQHQSLGRNTPFMNNAGSGLVAAQYAQERKGPVEFNHAIGYVNKIKTRFQAHPDIYKAFLEILQTYQKESKPIGDVYAQVTSLFAAAPDLLQDFKQFLPESAAQAKATQVAAAQRATDEQAMVSNMRGDPSYAVGQVPVQAHTPRPAEMKMPPVGNFAPPPSVGKENKKRRGGAGSQMTGGAAAPDPTPGPMQRGDKGAGARGGPASKKPRIEQARPPVPEVAPTSPTLVPSLPRPMPPSADGTSRADDLAFFDKVKKLLSNKTTYNEFLKLCNMYSQEIIDETTLRQKMQGFIGSSNELKQGLKKFFPDELPPIDVIDNRPSKEGKRVKLSNCRGLGPSYRLVPVAVRTEQCTGRDEMCKSVLNDEWASFPTWASEDSGFIAHRKNTFEEAIHRSEEERHDYDHNMEACQKTIQSMEQILQHMRTLPPEEEAVYRLPRPMDGLSEAIWQRVIKKIYGREHGAQVIEALYNHPSKVMPMLLWRLREKLEEWKTSYREWDKVWREQSMKLFYRSLDHQILTSKSLDKRQFQPKTLQGEITIKLQQQQRHRISNSLLPNHQIAHTFSDRDIIYDASHLILTFLRHDSGSVVGEESRTEQFFKTFIPTFFDLDTDDFASRMSDIEDEAPADDASDESMPLADRARLAPISNGLGSNHNGNATHNDTKESKESTPADMEIDGEIAEAEETPNEGPRRVDPAEYRWTEPAPIIDEDGRETRANEPFHRDTFTLFANVNIFCFFRLFQLLCERLGNIKANEAEVHEDVRRANIPRDADELGINDKPVSAYFYDDTPTANFYKQVVGMCEDVIKSKLEMPDLEETLRRFYIQKGWQLQSFKQLLVAMVRYASLIITSDSKDKSLDIVNFFYRDRNNDKTTHEAELMYRKQVEKFAKDGDIYRITYVSIRALSLSRYTFLPSLFSILYLKFTSLIANFIRTIEYHYVPLHNSTPPPRWLNVQLPVSLHPSTLASLRCLLQHAR